MMPPVFSRFVGHAPFCVLARMAIERLLLPERLDKLFVSVTERQQGRELLFSHVVELMMGVVLRVNSSVLAAWRDRRAALGVTDQAVYNRLQSMELGVSAALVANSADQVAPVIDQLQARQPAWLPGF